MDVPVHNLLHRRVMMYAELTPVSRGAVSKVKTNTVAVGASMPLTYGNIKIRALNAMDINFGRGLT